MKFLNKLHFIFLSITLLLIIIAGMIFIDPKQEQQEEQEVFYCGNVFLNQDEISSVDHSFGEQLFKDNCKSCHKIHEDAVGPALSGVSKQRSRAWLYVFIQNSQKLIAKKDTQAVNIYNKYGKAIMPAFQELTRADIDSILIYIDPEKNNE